MLLIDIVREKSIVQYLSGYGSMSPVGKTQCLRAIVIASLVEVNKTLGVNGNSDC